MKTRSLHIEPHKTPFYILFQVNGQTLSGMTHDAAVSVFKNTTGTAKLLIEQDAELTVLSVSSLRISLFHILKLVPLAY